eukprot:466198-Prorocentrum_minimum.AAC.23
MRASVPPAVHQTLVRRVHVRRQHVSYVSVAGSIRGAVVSVQRADHQLPASALPSLADGVVTVQVGVASGQRGAGRGLVPLLVSRQRGERGHETVERQRPKDVGRASHAQLLSPDPCHESRII